MQKSKLQQNNSLYGNNVPTVRSALLKQQGGKDAILQEEIKEAACLDHDHKSMRVRAVLSRGMNAFEGEVYNSYKRRLQYLTDKPLPVILRRLADYLEVDYSQNPYHPAWMKKVKTEFRKLSACRQNKVLLELGLESKPNAKAREQAFSKKLLDRSLGFDKIRTVINTAGENDGTSVLR